MGLLRRLLSPAEVWFEGDRLVEQSVRGRYELPVDAVIDVTVEVSSHSPARLCLATMAGNRISIAVIDATVALRHDLGVALVDVGRVSLSSPARRALELDDAPR